jgi:osmotically-inducible protein OsmY
MSEDLNLNPNGDEGAVDSAQPDALEEAFNSLTAASGEEVVQNDSSEEQSELDIDFEGLQRELAGEVEESAKIEEPAEESDSKEGAEESEGQTDEGASEEEATEEPAEEIKMLEASDGDNTIEISSDAKFKHKVDGEEVDVSVQELLNNYSGKVAYDRKFQELDVKKKEFEHDRTLVNDNINYFFQLASEGQEMEALDFLLERAGKAYGLDRNTFMNGFSEQLQPQVLEWMQMTDDEKHVKQLESENDYFKRQRESEAQRQSDEKVSLDLEQHVTKIQEIHEIDQAQFVEYYDQIVSNPKTIEGLSPQEVLNLVDRYIGNSKSFAEAKDILSGIDSSLADNDQAIWDFVDTVQQVDANLSRKELIEVAREVYGIDKIANQLSDRVNKNNANAKKSPARPAQKKAPSDRFAEFAEELKNIKLD